MTWRLPGLAAGVAAWLLGASLAAGASAEPLTSLRGMGLESIYGSYAPRADCARTPRVVIDETGLSFHAAGRVVRSARFERALTFMGPGYDGISSVFFPFPAGRSDFGPLLMIVNDDEKPGVIRFDSNLARGQRLEPFHAALAAGSPFLMCGKSPTAPPAGAGPMPERAPTRAGAPLDWRTLPTLVGEFGLQVDAGPIGSEIRAMLGGRSDVLKQNLSVGTPLRRQGSIYYLSGNAPHKGGEDQAYVLMDAGRRAVQVGLWERGKLTVYAAPGRRIAPPPDIQKLLASSPPEDAIAAPGRPWEVVPARNRPPIAYVDAAASPDIKSLSLFCEGSRPMMAMLLNKPFPQASLTMTWNFAGRLVNIPVVRGNREGTFWQGNIAGSPLVSLLMRQQGSVYLRIDGRLEGEALLTGAPAVLRTALRSCQRF